MKNIFLLFCSFSFFASFGQLTPVVDMGMHTQAIEVSAKYADSFPSGKSVQLANGYKVRVFYAGGLSKPRFITFSPQGVLHVSDFGNGKIYAMPDANQDGVADTAIVVASGFLNNHDVKFYKGAMYVTETFKVWKCTDANQDGIYETKTLFIDTIANTSQAGNHRTRTIVFDSLNSKLYLSIGSSCNVCRETRRAIIEQYNDDGTGGRVYATGVRNAVGMTLHPVTNRLWANNNGSDYLGNELPPEWIDLVRDGGFYGHPFAHSNQQWFNFDAVPDYQALKPITAADSANVQKMVAPAALLRAHSAPMAIQFLNPSFPLNMRNGFLNALRGSWNTTNPNDFRGYKVIYADLSSALDTTVNFVSDFISGFLTDSVARTFWGRPVGLAADNSGNIFMSSDEDNKFILNIYPSSNIGMEEPRPSAAAGTAYPNPFNTGLNVPLYLDRASWVNASLIDLTGREVIVFGNMMQSGNGTLSLDASQLREGLHFLQIRIGTQVFTQKVNCLK